MANYNDNTFLTGFAPYNFIPFYTGEVPVRYKRDEKGKENVPAFNAHNDGTLSGYIDYNVRVLTDIAIGDSTSREESASGDYRRFFRDAENHPAIPGSEMRGLVRSAAEILSLARPDAIANERYMYRAIDSNCIKLYKEYRSYLVGKSARPRKGEPVDGRTKTPEGVVAGILSRKGSQYFIQPVQDIPGTSNTFLRISEKTLRNAQDTLALDESHFLFKDELCQQVNPSYHPYRSNEIQFSYENRKLRFNVQGGTGTKGMLLNSEYIGNDKEDTGTYKDGTPYPNGKSHHYLVCTVPDTRQRRIKVSPEDARAYQHDYERNCIQNARLKEYKEFYALPESDSKTKVFFYKVGDDGRLLGFGPTPYFRIYYRGSVHDGLPMKYDRASGLDYVLSMFGYIGDKDSKDIGYKSRLSFQNATLGSYTKDDFTVRDFALLGPKGSAFDMYLEQVDRSLKGEGNSGLSTPNDERFRLRGSKVYWKRSKALIPNWKGDNTTVLSHLEVLKAGRDQQRTFAGRVYFDHLHEDELGLLLMSLQYKDATDSKTHESRLLGSARPYGYGKVEISVQRLRLLNDRTRFTALNPDPDEASNDAIEAYKQSFKDAVAERLKESGDHTGYEDLPTIKVYKAWLANEEVDSYLDQYEDCIYMPIEGNERRTPLYGKCEPMAMAADVLGVSVAKERITNEVRKKNSAGGGSAAPAVRTFGDTPSGSKRSKELGYYRLIVTGKPQNGFFTVKPDSGDTDTIKKFGSVRKEARCYEDKSNAKYPSNYSGIKPGMVIYADLKEDPDRKNGKVPKIKEFNAMNWYTEEE